MNLVWVLLIFVIFSNGCFSDGVSTNISTRPAVVNIGSIFTLDSIIGKATKIAIEAAIEDVNSNPAILGGTKLKLTMHDSNFSGFLGIVQALQFMEMDTVAIVGPQSSIIAHVISLIANELHVPILSFAATDPTLNSLQDPFFVRTTQNDLFQMTAIAEMVEYYEWREVIAIYVDDDYGRNGIAALADQLASKRCRISYKAPLNPQPSRTGITDVLVKVAMSESRILVLHTYPGWGLDVLSVAHYLGMTGSGYVWIATNWLSTILDSRSSLPPGTTEIIQGLITLRMHTPDSEMKRNFVSRWKNMTRINQTDDGSIGLHTYALYAYDTVWMLAHAIDAFLDQGGNISFSNDPSLSALDGRNLHLNALNVFNGGKLLLDNILRVNFTGITGPIWFTSNESLVHPAFEIINLSGTGMRRIGYWSNYSGLSVVPPEALYSKPPNRSSSNQQLYDVIWPGETTKKPRGWVFPNNGRELKIGVPNGVSYREFIGQVPGTDMFKGYCIDVFTAAVNFLPYGVPYKLIPFGDGINSPSRTELVRLITTGVYDAAIGDITIIPNRTRMVDFTQPYIGSGLVVVAPVRKLNTHAWAFLRPFTPMMWCVTGIFSLFVGAVVWILEHRLNDDFRGPPRKQLITTLWFSFSTLFFAHREKTVSTLGRLVLLLWLFVVLIINSSYTASLTSILTVQQLSSSIKGIHSLMTSNDPIGYQQGSFTWNYLSEELGIHKSRLVPLNSPEDYAKALKDGPKKGGVAAVVDERAYMELFLSSRCEFSIVGQEFTKNGWGFAFPRDSPLAVDMSTAILRLSENGELQRIHDKWLMRSACTLQDAKMEVERLHLSSFSGLFLISGLACGLALLVYFVKTIRQFSRLYAGDDQAQSSSASSSRSAGDDQAQSSSASSSRSARLLTFLSFVDRKEELVKSSRSKRRKGSNRSSNGAGDESKVASIKSHPEISTSNRRVSFGP